MIQDLLGHIYAPLGRTESIFSNIVATVLCVAGWGYFVYQGTIDPLGGVNTIWPLFGISNQMLAGIALLLATRAHQDQARALRMGDARADGMAAGVHAFGGMDEGVVERSDDRFSSSWPTSTARRHRPVP